MTLLGTVTKRGAYDTMIDLAEKSFNFPIRKKIWHQTAGLLRTGEQGFVLGTLCGLFGYSSLSYYKRNESVHHHG